jgi:hypothetical protein
MIVLIIKLQKLMQANNVNKEASKPMEKLVT